MQGQSDPKPQFKDVNNYYYNRTHYPHKSKPYQHGYHQRSYNPYYAKKRNHYSLPPNQQFQFNYSSNPYQSQYLLQMTEMYIMNKYPSLLSINSSHDNLSLA